MVHNTRQRGQPVATISAFWSCARIFTIHLARGSSIFVMKIHCLAMILLRPCRQQGVFFFFDNFREIKCNGLRLNCDLSVAFLETILSLFIYLFIFWSLMNVLREDEWNLGRGKSIRVCDVEMVFEYLDEINLNIPLRVSSHLLQFVRAKICKI